MCSYNFCQGAVFESWSVPFLFSFCLSLFCFVFVFVLLLLFVRYIPSRAQIVYLWINNLNFYHFLQFSFLFYCNIFYKTKTVATCGHRLPFIIQAKFWLLIFAFGTRGLFWTQYILQSCFHINNCLSLVSVIALYLKWRFWNVYTSTLY